MAKLTGKRQQKITSLVPDSMAAPVDRRDNGRANSSLTCSCTVITLQQRPPFWPAKVRDVSTSGIGLVVNRALEPGTFLAIHVNTHFDRPLRARVVHSTLQRPEMSWVVGCTLTHRLSVDELQVLR